MSFVACCSIALLSPLHFAGEVAFPQKAAPESLILRVQQPVGVPSPAPAPVTPAPQPGIPPAPPAAPVFAGSPPQPPAAALQWIIKPPPMALALQAGDDIPIGIVVGGAAAKDIRVFQSGLLEQTRKYRWEKNGFALCVSDQKGVASCAPTIDQIAPQSSRTVGLRASGGSAVGHFVGPVTISSSLKPEGETVNIDVYVTTPWHQFFGVATIFISVLLAWVISSYARTRYTRGQLILPAAFLREKLAGLEAKLSGHPPEIQNKNIASTKSRVDSSIAELSDGALEAARYVPPRQPNPFGATALRPDEYTQFIRTADDCALVLKAVIEGMSSAWQKGDLSKGSVSDLVNGAVAAMDGLVPANGVPVLATVEAALQAELRKLEKDLHALEGSGVAPMQSMAPVPKPSAQTYTELRVEMQFISVAAAATTVLATTLLGAYVVVLSNLGFGTWTDYLVCIFWGLGLPMAAQQLLQQTSASVPTALGITVAK